MRDADGAVVRPVHRVRGRANLEAALRRLLVRVHRYGRHRAISRADITWTAQVIDALTSLLDVHNRENTREQ